MWHSYEVQTSSKIARLLWFWLWGISMREIVFLHTSMWCSRISRDRTNYQDFSPFYFSRFGKYLNGSTLLSRTFNRPEIVASSVVNFEIILYPSVKKSVKIYNKFIFVCFSVSILFSGLKVVFFKCSKWIIWLLSLSGKH